MSFGEGSEVSIQHRHGRSTGIAGSSNSKASQYAFIIKCDEMVKDAAGNYTGLLTGLAKGNNEVAATAGADKASLTIVDHGINETLFAGPQQTPWVCEVDTFGLAKATDASCASPTKTAYYYKNKTAQWKPFDQANRPGDIATTKIGTKDVVRDLFMTVTSVEVDLKNNGAANFSFSVASAFDWETRGFVAGKDEERIDLLELFAFGSPIEISLGYGEPSRLKLMLKGIVTEIGTSFTSGALHNLLTPASVTSHAA